jgi:hypothetical protein
MLKHASAPFGKLRRNMYGNIDFTFGFA